jgi:hypothetical protein
MLLGTLRCTLGVWKIIFGNPLVLEVLDIVVFTVCGFH